MVKNMTDETALGLTSIACRDFIIEVHRFHGIVQDRGLKWEDDALDNFLMSLHRHQAKWAIESIKMRRM